MQSNRTLSSQGDAAVAKLRTLMEEYRAQNYQQELPTRFKKDIVKAALSNKQSDLVGLDGMQRVLTNIGAESRISDGDMQLIFKELGNEAGKIPINRLVQIL